MSASGFQTLRDIISDIKTAYYLNVVKNIVSRNEQLQSDLENLRTKVKALTIERDFAIAHDLQPYPTVFAYETACGALWKQRNRAEKAEGEIVGFDEFHPRAMKLIRKRKNFLVVAQDEPYFYSVYCQIRENEKKFGRWTDEDEIKFLEIGKEFSKRPIIDDPLEKTK